MESNKRNDPFHTKETEVLWPITKAVSISICPHDAAESALAKASQSSSSISCQIITDRERVNIDVLTSWTESSCDTPTTSL